MNSSVVQGLVCITDSTESEVKFFLLPSGITLDELCKEFGVPDRNYFGFTEFLKHRGCQLVEVETLDLPSYSDPEW